MPHIVARSGEKKFQLLCLNVDIADARISGPGEKLLWMKWCGKKLTFRFVCQFLPHANSSCVHILALCRAGMTCPDLTSCALHGLPRHGIREQSHEKTNIIAES